jgi:hypothetical protein
MSTPAAAPTAGTVLRDLRYALRSRAARRPSYLALARLGRHRDEAVEGDTAILIEGFPRSANTFAAIAFQTAQERPVKIAHHLHAAANVSAAVRRGIPTLLLVRPPRDAVLSEVVREWPVSIRTVAEAYARFYETVAPHAADVVVGDFRSVTEDLGSVIVRVNERFGTAFAPFAHTAENIETVFRLIDERERDPDRKVVDEYLAGRRTLAQTMAALGAPGDDDRPVPEASVPRPAEARRAGRPDLEARLGEPGVARALARAERAYERVGEASVR